ncbi:MAG: lactonase family protein [Eubacteriales bacterium]|nr:lactonase family protein [Eubacteriales bacterium]
MAEQKKEAAKQKTGATGKYVAYVSSYTMTQKEKYGIRVYDVDLEAGRMCEKDKVEITNSSYISLSHDQRFLYSITDFGVESYRIEADGTLSFINHASINGMRGSHLSTDYTDSWLFVGGYHDGKITVLQLGEDGSVGEITDEVYHKGLGSIAERNFRPHVQCVKMTRDNHYLLAADLGMDQTIVYRFDAKNGKLKHADIIHSELESAPRHLAFSKEGRHLYIVHELKNSIDVYSYRENDGMPDFEKIQSVPTMNEQHSTGSAASALNFSADYSYLITSNAGDNSVAVFAVDKESGLLEKKFCLPVSGDYPKDADLFPDNRHLVALNQESNSLTFFTMDGENGLLVMNGKELPVKQPNCIAFRKLA